jgi:hypothetical protein
VFLKIRYKLLSGGNRVLNIPRARKQLCFTLQAANLGKAQHLFVVRPVLRQRKMQGFPCPLAFLIDVEIELPLFLPGFNTYTGLRTVYNSFTENCKKKANNVNG